MFSTRPTILPEKEAPMPEVYKQSFKQNYTNNVDLSVFNCGLERCAPGHT